MIDDGNIAAECLPSPQFVGNSLIRRAQCPLISWKYTPDGFVLYRLERPLVNLYLTNRKNEITRGHCPFPALVAASPPHWGKGARANSWDSWGIPVQKSSPWGPISCPGELTGNVLAPDLTVPVSRAQPNEVFGNSHNYTVTTPRDKGTVQNFNIPREAAGKNCSLYFSLPSQDQSPRNTRYCFNGPGNVFHDLETKNFVHSNLYFLSTTPCPVDEIGGVVTSDDTRLEFYQTDGQGVVNGNGPGGCPLGLFTTYPN